MTTGQVDCVMFFALASPHRRSEVRDFFNNDDPLHGFRVPFGMRLHDEYRAVSMPHSEEMAIHGERPPIDERYYGDWRTPEEKRRAAAGLNLSLEYLKNLADRLNISVEQARVYHVTMRKCDAPPSEEEKAKRVERKRKSREREVAKSLANAEMQRHREQLQQRDEEAELNGDSGIADILRAYGVCLKCVYSLSGNEGACGVGGCPKYYRDNRTPLGKCDSCGFTILNGRCSRGCNGNNRSRT